MDTQLGVDPAAPGDTEKSPKGSSQPAEQLPTDRIAFDKQMRLLLAYSAASDGGQNAVSNEDVASVVEMNSSTVSLANAFFVKMGFLSRSGRGYLPAREVVEYANAHAWEPDEAGRKLAPLIEKSWFWSAARPKLLMRSVDESEMLSELAQKAMVGPSYRPQLRMLVNYMLASGLVRKDGDRVTLVRDRPEAEPPGATASHQRTTGEMPDDLPPQRKIPPGSQLHLMVQGLLLKLPAEGEAWSVEERARWLRTAESMFGLLYEGEGEIEIEVRKK